MSRGGPLRAAPAARCGAVALLLALAGCAAGDERPVAPLCEVLAALGRGEIDVGDSSNELAGHVASLEALLAVAPRAVAGDLERLRDVLADARDAGGAGALLVFGALTDPELAGVEGRIAEFVARECGGDLEAVDYEVAPRAEQEPRCPAWPRVGTPLANNRFPYLLDTSAANYASTVLWSVPYLPAPPGMIRVPRGGRVELSGEYPHARYFAFHPNDVETNNLETLVDAEIDPDPGSHNPWRGAPPPGAGRRYTARLVFAAPPGAPEPNTMYVGERARGGFNPVVFLLYRIYGSEQGALPPNTAGVPLPALAIYDAEGDLVERHAACDPHPAGAEPAVDRTRFPVFPVADHRAARHAGALRLAPNWGLPVDLLANRDVLYLSTFFSRARGELLALRARRPRTPDPAAGRPLHAPDRELELWSACTYNFWNGAAVACRMDHEIAADAAGEYTLVVSPPEARPANATPEHGVTWLDAGPFLDVQLTLRMLRAEAPLLRGLRSAIESGEAAPGIEPFVPRSALCSRRAFESGGFEACLAEGLGRAERAGRRAGPPGPAA